MVLMTRVAWFVGVMAAVLALCGGVARAQRKPAQEAEAARGLDPELTKVFNYATAALDGSLIIGSQSYQLFAQPLEVIDAWADAFEKVWTNLRF